MRVKIIKYLTLVFWLICLKDPAVACDVCGCSVGGNYLGILPQYRQHFIGVRYDYQSFTSEHPPLFGGDDRIVSSEYFQTEEIWGRFYPHPRVQVFAFIPFHQYKKTEDGVTTLNEGLGDVSVLVNYVLINSGDSIKNSVKHRLQFGGGIKLPTGRNNMGSENEDPIANLQPGTGSYDFLFNAIYTIRYKKFGLNNEFSYRINTASNRDYKFGNRVNIASQVFYWQNLGGLTFLPQAGFRYEYADMDYINYPQKELQDLSGGSRYLATAALDLYIGSFSAGVSWTKPVYQDFASGNIKSHDQWSLKLIYLFNKRKNESN